MKVKDTKLRRMVLRDEKAIKAIRTAAAKGEQTARVKVDGKRVTFKRSTMPCGRH